MDEVAQIERFALDDDRSLESVAYGKLRVLHMADDVATATQMFHDAEAVGQPSETETEPARQTLALHMAREDAAAAVVPVGRQERSIVPEAQEVSQHIERTPSALDVAHAIEAPDTLQRIHAQRLVLLLLNQFREPHKIPRLTHPPANLLLDSLAE